MAKEAGAELQRLVEIMARLRAEGGCPWDREQDIRSLRPYLIEEAYEVLDEMDRVGAGGPWRPLCEELGDLLFQIVFHAQLATELGEFEMADVAAAISDKIVSRHPHVFGDAQVSGAEQVLQNWAKLKAEERRRKHGREGSVLDGVPTFAPSLQRAERLTEKASRIGFDWPDLAGVRGKLQEELNELDEAIATGDRDAREHELGDVLFSLANLARFIQTPPEDAARQANRRFTERFHEIEAGLREQGVPFGEASLEQMEALWQRAKGKEASVPKPVRLHRAPVQTLRFESKLGEDVLRFWNALAPLLGWERVPRTGADLLAFDAGDLRFELVRTDAERAAAASVSVTFGAPSLAAITRVEETLAELTGTAGKAAQRIDDGRTLTFQDPDGHVFRYAFGA